jgi:polyketide synthase PksM
VSVRPPADDIDSQLRLPVYIESFRASAPLRSRCTARLRTESMHTKGGAFYSTVEFFDERGRKVAELRNVATTAGLAGTAAAAAQVAKTDAAGAGHGVESEQDVAAVQKVETLLLAEVAEKGGGLPEGFDSTVHFAASGLDSASLLGLLQDLEKRIGQPVSPVVLFEYPTIHDLASFLVATYGAALLEVKLAAKSVAVEAHNGAETVVGSLAGVPLKEAPALPAES